MGSNLKLERGLYQIRGSAKAVVAKRLQQDETEDKLL